MESKVYDICAVVGTVVATLLVFDSQIHGFPSGNILERFIHSEYLHGAELTAGIILGVIAIFFVVRSKHIKGGGAGSRVKQ